LEKTVAFLYSNQDFKDIKPIHTEDLVDREFLAKANETLGSSAGTFIDKP
jgi:hypothetical protein